MSLANSIDSTRSRGGSLTTVGILGPPENEVFFPEEFKRAELKLCLSDICSWTTDPVKFKEALCKTLKNLYLCVWGLDSSATAEVYKYISSRIKETYGNPRGIALELQDLREIIQHNHGCVGHCWQIRTRLHQLKKWRMALEVSVESEKVSSSLKSQSIHTWYVERLVYLRTVTNKCWGQLKHIPQQEVATSISLRLLIMNDNEDDNGTDASTAQISQLETVADSESSQKTSGIRVNHGSLAGKQLDTVGGKFSENPTDWEIVRHPYIQRVPPDADFGKCVRKGLSLFRLPPSVQDRYRDLWARDSQNRVEGGYLQNVSLSIPPRE